MNKFKVTLNVDDGNKFTAIFNDEKEADKFVSSWTRVNESTTYKSILKEKINYKE